ncbi:MAG: nucleotide sugar dehydrogenase, partial [Chthoniobacterales bacterium]
GLGYVGLPLAMRFVQMGVTVAGIDVDSDKVAGLKRGRSKIPAVKSADVRAGLRSKRLAFSGDFRPVAKSTNVIICVPTPLNRNREPDLSHVVAACEGIASALRPGTLVVLESTTYPGTTEEVLRPILEKGSGLRAGRDFHLAFSPEREDPGNPDSHVSKVPKIVGGLTPKCLARAIALYDKVAGKVVPVSSCRAAEATKLMENIFRSVNIALVNELKVVYAAMGIDIWEVVAAASTKPFGFMPFYPGPGLGGHCIPIDPFYLTWKAREYNQSCKFVELAGEINSAMPDYVAQRAAEALNHHGKPLKGSRVLLVGVAYKPNISDDRESPAYRVIESLAARGAMMAYHDPFIPVVRAGGKSLRSVPWTATELARYDAAVITTAHRGVDLSLLLRKCPCIVDTRNALEGLRARKGQVWKA